jgi:DNA-binding beta-propeller fold protein YncE
MKEKKMKRIFLRLIVICLTLFIVLPARADNSEHGPKGKVVVANRASGTISVIDARSDALIGTYDLPAGDNAPEPMYVTYSQRGGHVFVGDRANNRVVVFDKTDFSVVATIPAGNGVFHMWSDDRDRQLWVNNDIDNTATVINPVSLSVIATVPMPADLVAEGFKPHDVILSPKGRFAYVTLVGGGGENDYLIQFSTASFTELNRAAVGKDPHVSLTRRNRLLYVPAQNSNIVSVFNRYTLELVSELTVPGAHGAGMAPNGKVFYTTNLPGGGTDGIFAIDTHTNTILGSSDTPFAVPHNIVVTKNDKLFLTHSGAASDKVTIYAVSAHAPVPVLIGEVTVGLNPFGLAYVPGR